MTDKQRDRQTNTLTHKFRKSGSGWIEISDGEATAPQKLRVFFLYLIEQGSGAIADIRMQVIAYSGTRSQL